MNNEKQISLFYSIVSVLFSAVAITVLAFIFLHSAVFEPLPNIIPFSLATVIGVALTQWGHIAFYAHKNMDTRRLKEVLGLRTKLPLKQYLVWVPVLILITGALFTITQPISVLLQEYVFFWIPEWFIPSVGFSAYSESVVWLTYGCLFICASILVPISEEVFFRGFLLPRMEWMGKAALPVNLALFVCYHFWSPWMIVTRFIACFPLYYIMKKKNSLMLGIIIHCSVNFISDVLGGVIVYLSSR